MEPALTLAIICIGVLVASLVVDLSGSALVALSRVGPATRWSVAPRLARFVAAVIVLSALLRMGQVAAATPPPMHRLERSDPTLLEAPAPYAESIRTMASKLSTHVVAKGECLWRIARRHLDASGLPASGTDVSRLWRAIYAENRDVIGDDPDLILPGQVLTIPGDLHGT